MSKGLIAFIAIACIAVIAALIIFLKQSADAARKQSEKILEQFKTIDKSLDKTTNQFDSLNNMYFDSLRKADK